ncbi:MAG: ABC transporter permease [Ignavibacteria bacterium]|jgi:lipoprotein-releasing system permease protein|nr:ABC transporter permease [Ignavibacteria bacterium]MCU7501605.1 ABC transporter permease [Ignavibacteria bacterium]MCU7517142.1 ABC transporter permease [Ignavibacteria bacterium]
MSVSFFIANRFTGSKKNSRLISLISVISITGIAIGVATLIIALTVINGFEKAISDKIVQINSHVQISSFSNRNLPDYNIILPVLERRLRPYSRGVSPFALRLAIIKHKHNTEGITLKGILPGYTNTEIRNYIVDGKFDISYADDMPPIVLGRKLADKLFAKVGDRVTIFTLKQLSTPSPENPPSIKQFRVAGIFESNLAEYDDQFCYINMHIAQEIFGMNDNVNGYDIKLSDFTKADSIANNLNYYLGYPYYARSIFKIYQNIFTWIDLQKKLVPIALVLIVVVAAFNIVGTLLMIVLERSNAIGTLKSLGARSRQIVSIFVYQGIYISLIGILAGNMLAYLLSILQDRFDLVTLPETVYFMSKAPVLIDWHNYLIVSGATFVLCFFTTLIPSYIASKINPISALRFD